MMAQPVMILAAKSVHHGTTTQVPMTILPSVVLPEPVYLAVTARCGATLSRGAFPAPTVVWTVSIALSPSRIAAGDQMQRIPSLLPLLALPPTLLSLLLLLLLPLTRLLLLSALLLPQLVLHRLPVAIVPILVSRHHSTGIDQSPSQTFFHRLKAKPKITSCLCPSKVGEPQSERH